MGSVDNGLFKSGIENERANLANLFRQTPEMVCILSGPEHRFEFVNEAHIRVLGFDATGKTLREAQPESVEVHGILDGVYQTGVTASLVEIPVTVTNRLRYFNLTYSAHRSATGEVDGVMVLGSEVTDMVLARREQENQQHWLESVLDRLPTSVFFIDPRTNKIMFANAASKRMMGVELEGTQVSERHGEGRIRVFLEGREVDSSELPSTRASRGEAMRDIAYVIQTQDARFEVSASSYILPATFGQPETAVLLLKDMTALRTSESALRRSEEQLSSALAVSKVGFYDWDIRNDRVTYSDQMLRDWGMSASDVNLPLAHVLERIHSEDRPRTIEMIRVAMEERKPFATEYRVVHSSGKTIWVEVRGSVHYDAAGEPVRFFGTSLDVTERRLAVETLRESEQSLRLLADSMPQIVWAAGPDGILNYTNERWTEYSGNPDPASWIEAVHPEDVPRVVPIWAASVTTGAPYETEFRLRRQDGVYRWFLVRALSMRSAGVITQWMGTCTDIEAQKVAEFALSAANLAAESANASKSAFLANMSHEIRTPLGAILGFVGLMKSPKASPYNLASYIAVIERNSDHLLRIIDDILDLSKVEAGQMQIEKIEFSLPEVLADFASLMGFRAREKAVEFELRALTALPAGVVSDPTRIRQVLTNVVGNALKFTERGKVSLEVAFAGDRLSFVVTDTGLGISDEQRDGLFQPFAQADVSTTRKFGGTGLGLVLTRRLCEALGGEFTLRASALGKGSVFEASVRIELVPGTPMMAAKAIRFDSVPLASAQPENTLDGLRVLIVEDSPDNQTLFRIMLEDVGASVTVVGDGEIGVETATAQAFDVVLMDIQMPRMDGHAAARMLRSQGYKVPMIALTAHAMKDERERCLASGFSHFLAKPVDRKALLGLLSEIPKTPTITGTPKKASASGFQVVFVEDDADIRNSICELLELDGYSVKGIPNAEEGLLYLEATTGPIFLMTDLSLPKMSGQEFVQLLGKRPDRARFHIIVASGWGDLSRKALEIGADGFLRKPFDAELVLARIEKFVDTFSRA